MLLRTRLERAIAAIPADEEPMWRAAEFALSASKGQDSEKRQVIGSMHLLFGYGALFAMHRENVLKNIWERMPLKNTHWLSEQKREIDITLQRFFGNQKMANRFGMIRIMPVRTCFRQAIAHPLGYHCPNHPPDAQTPFGRPGLADDVPLWLSAHSPQLVLPASGICFAIPPGVWSNQRVVKICTTRSSSSRAQPVDGNLPLTPLDLIQKQSAVGVLDPRDVDSGGFTGFFPAQFESSNFKGELLTYVDNPTLVLTRVVPVGSHDLGVEQLLWSFETRGKTTGILGTYSTMSQLLLVPGIKEALNDWLQEHEQ